MITIIGGALIGIAVACLVSLALPAKPQLASAMATLGSEPIRGEQRALTRKDRIGRWALSNVPISLGRPTSHSDLALVGISEVDHYYNKAVCAAAGPLIALILGFYGQMIGVPYLTLPALSFIPITLLLWRRPDMTVQRQAAKARQEFGRGVGAFIELVAAEIRRDAPVSSALTQAASISDSWIFRRIAEELNRSRYRNVQTWDALLELSEELETPELGEAARIARLSGKDGGRVYDSLRSLGHNLRIHSLSQEHARANVISGKINQKITFLVMTFMGLIIVPMLLTISN